MPRGGVRKPGPGKKLGRPLMDGKTKKVNKSITMYPKQWKELHSIKPDLPLGHSVIWLMERVKELEEQNELLKQADLTFYSDR